MSFCFDAKVCQNIKEALAREWLETNGMGGYASSTILNCHTRRYHGLLVANLERPAGRHVLLSRIEESLFAEDREFFLSCNRYPGIFHPHGHQYMQEFRLDECPALHLPDRHHQVQQIRIQPPGCSLSRDDGLVWPTCSAGLNLTKLLRGAAGRRELPWRYERGERIGAPLLAEIANGPHLQHHGMARQGDQTSEFPDRL